MRVRICSIAAFPYIREGFQHAHTNRPHTRGGLPRQDKATRDGVGCRHDEVRRSRLPSTAKTSGGPFFDFTFSLPPRACFSCRVKQTKTEKPARLFFLLSRSLRHSVKYEVLTASHTRPPPHAPQLLDASGSLPGSSTAAPTSSSPAAAASASLPPAPHLRHG